MDLFLETDFLPDRTVVMVKGELDMATAPGLRDHLAASLSRTDHLVLDLTGISFMDSSGLQALVATRRRANLGNDRFQLRLVPDGPVDRLLTLTGLHDVFEVDPG